MLPIISELIKLLWRTCIEIIIDQLEKLRNEIHVCYCQVNVIVFHTIFMYYYIWIFTWVLPYIEVLFTTLSRVRWIILK